jgi:hypothetical protein
MKITLAATKAVGCLALALTAFGLAGAVTPASAQTYWQAQDMGVASDGTSRVLWTADTTTGEVAGIWKMDANGNKVASGPVYGPYQDGSGNEWQPDELIVMPDGTSHLRWEAHSSAGIEEVIWTFDSNGNETSTGTVYGPLGDAGGEWVPLETLPASDGSLRQLWVYNATNGGAMSIIWTLNSSGARTGYGPVYGPFYNGSAVWHPGEMLIAPDNSLRMLWESYGSGQRGVSGYGGDTMLFWSLDTSGNRTGTGSVYGPYSGWVAANFSINPSDSTMRVLWKQLGTYDSNGENYTGDVMGLWSFSSSGNETATGTTYGPYAGWTADAVISLPGGTSRVEWENSYTNSTSGASEDLVGLWTFSSSDINTSKGPAYGPYDGWTLTSTSVDTSDYSFRLLWTRDDGAAGLWSANSSGVQTSVGPTYGPYLYSN